MTGSMCGTRAGGSPGLGKPIGSSFGLGSLLGQLKEKAEAGEREEGVVVVLEGCAQAVRTQLPQVAARAAGELGRGSKSMWA